MIFTNAIAELNHKNSQMDCFDEEDSKSANPIPFARRNSPEFDDNILATPFETGHTESSIVAGGILAIDHESDSTSDDAMSHLSD